MRRLPVEAGHLGGGVDVRAAHRVNRHEQGDEDTGQRGMDARAVQGVPGHDGQEDVRGHAPHAPAGQEHDPQQPQYRTAQRHEVERAGIEDRDDHQCADVVDDGEGEEEGAQTRGPLGPDEREHAQGEGRIGGDDRSPRVRAIGAVRDRRVGECRDHEAADGGDDGQERPTGQSQLPEGEIAPHIQAHHEEEGGHEAFIDPAVKTELDL